MLRPAGFHLESWMTKVHPNLQLLLNYSNDDLKSCYSALIENDGMIENADGTILPRTGHVIEHATAPLRLQSPGPIKKGFTELATFR